MYLLGESMALKLLLGAKLCVPSVFPNISMEVYLCMVTRKKQPKLQPTHMCAWFQCRFHGRKNYLIFKARSFHKCSVLVIRRLSFKARMWLCSKGSVQSMTPSVHLYCCRQQALEIRLWRTVFLVPNSSVCLSFITWAGESKMNWDESGGFSPHKVGSNIKLVHKVIFCTHLCKGGSSLGMLLPGVPRTSVPSSTNLEELGSG